LTPDGRQKPWRIAILQHPDEAAVGCIAVPASEIVALQYFAQEEVVLAVLPKQALGRSKGCLPREAAS
jgi:hypothetical protein